MLDKFQACTEQRKEWKQHCKAPPRPAELGPIANMSFESAVKQTQKALKIDKHSEVLKKEVTSNTASVETKASVETTASV